MTIKYRNRITSFFFLVSIIYFLITIFFLLYQFFTKTLVFPKVTLTSIPTGFLVTKNNTAIIISILLIISYVCVTTYIIKINFQKTQATDMLFFIFFLIGLECDTIRIYLILLNCFNTYSSFLILLANISLFGKILAPLSIISSIIFSNDEYRKSVDQNSLIILISSLFFANLIPINTAIITPNFSISFAYVNCIRVFTIIVFLISIFSLLIKNKKNEYSQKSTIGLIFICTGYLISVYGYSIVTTFLSIIFLLLGTHYYISTIHKQYLWGN